MTRIQTKISPRKVLHVGHVLILRRALDNRGKELIDICISNQMRNINGRTTGDIFFSIFLYLIVNEKL